MQTAVGLEPPIPKEGWDKSKDKVLLFALLKEDEGEGSVHYMTSEELHKLPPFNRWPFYRFKPNFYNLRRDIVIQREAIAKRDADDFLIDLAAHPRSKLTRKGMFLRSDKKICRHYLTFENISKGVPRWDGSIACDLLSQDLKNAMETNTMVKEKELYLSRPKYQEYGLKMFRDKIAQHKRYIIEPTGWFTNETKKHGRHTTRKLKS